MQIDVICPNASAEANETNITGNETGEWTHGLVYLCNGILLSHQKEQEGQWTYLRNMTLSKRSQTQAYTLHGSTYLKLESRRPLCSECLLFAGERACLHMGPRKLWVMQMSPILVGVAVTQVCT